jgi:tetratricopeptide (TPR) repeat protein
MLASVGMVGHRYLAKIPLSAENNFSVSSQTSYRPNPALELALAMDPDLAEAYDDRGCEKLIAGEPSAGADFSKVLQLRPGDAIVYMHRAKADELVGQFAKAASDLQRCQKLGPGIASGLDLPVAYYLGRAKQYDKALAIYDDVIGHPSGFGLTQAYALRSDIHLRLGNLKQALADVNKAMAEAPGDATFLILRAQIHEKNGEANLATEDYKAVLKKRHSGKRGAADDAADADKAGTHLSYAIAAQKLGLFDQAKEDLAQAAKYKAPRETNGFNEIHDTWLIPDTPRP